MKQEKAIIKLRLLFGRLKEYRKAAFFGVNAKSPEVLNLWTEYNELKNTFAEIDPELFGDLKEVNRPAPTSASTFSHQPAGSPVYNPNHFDALEEEIEKAMGYITLIQKDNAANDTNQIKGNIQITATEGSLVNVTVGDNNKTLQNTGQIDKVLEELEALGVDKSDLESIKEIINQNAKGEENKLGTGKRILTWIGSLASKVVEKGLTENLPAIIEKAQSLIDLI